MATRDWGLLLLLSLPWGLSFLFYRMLAAELPPLLVSLGRVGIAAAAMSLLLQARGESLFGARALWGPFLIIGLLNNAIPFTLFAFAETRITGGTAAILNATTPIFAVLLAHALTGTEKLTVRRGVGTLFGFAGVAVLVGPDAWSSLSSGNLIAEASCLLASLTYAYAAIFSRRFRGVSPLLIATGQTVGSTLILLPVALVFDPPWLLGSLSLSGWGAMLGISLLSTAFGYVLYFRILVTAGPTNLMLVTFLTPVTAILAGYVALGEAVTPMALVGMALIAAGLAAIDGRVFRLIGGGSRP